MNGPFTDEYWKAAERELFPWKEWVHGMWLSMKNDMNVINGTWAFKCKQYLNGTMKKFKAGFCAHGNQQLEGIDFFETYAPIVQLTTVHLMLILENLLSLKSKQADVTSIFLHVTLA